MIGHALYRDSDGEMKAVEELSQQGYDENVRAGVFAVGGCAIDGHIPSREILRMKPPIQLVPPLPDTVLDHRRRVRTFPASVAAWCDSAERGSSWEVACSTVAAAE